MPKALQSSTLTSVTVIAIIMLSLMALRAPTARGDVTVLTSAPGSLSYWAFLEERAAAHRDPSATSAVVARLHAQTYERTSELVMVIAEVENLRGELWYHVRLPSRPNNVTGWLPQYKLGELRTTTKLLVINRRRLTATLIDRGRITFRARVGIGRAKWPTPAGEFYVRSKFAHTSGVYGKLAFGTSATSDVLTDWPGGGYIGLHGTDQPELLPGRVSHGCVRFRNADIVRLGTKLGIGTPISIR